MRRVSLDKICIGCSNLGKWTKDSRFTQTDLKHAQYK